MRSLPAFLLASLTPCASALALSISVTYQNPSDPFFTAQAQSTLQKAADDVSFAITTTLAALNQNVYVGINGATTAEVEWNFSYTNPENGSTTITLDAFDFLENEFRLFVGSRSLSELTLGVGGPAGTGIGLLRDGFESQWIGAIADMEASSNASMPRGGPPLRNFSGNFNFGSTDGFYSLDYGYAIGAVAFNKEVAWHFDYHTLPGIEQSDFYSVAVHEILHALGFGTGETWDEHVSGTNWTGEAVIGLLGTGTNVLWAEPDHIADSLTGHPLIDGIFHYDIEQEAAMDRDLTVGTRKYLTDLDLAFLSDMGWTVVPEPSAVVLLLGSAIGFAFLRRRKSLSQ